MTEAIRFIGPGALGAPVAAKAPMSVQSPIPAKDLGLFLAAAREAGSPGDLATLLLARRT
jgi:hypothetical protein